MSKSKRLTCKTCNVAKGCDLCNDCEVILRDYPVQDATWPSRRWNKEKTDYIDLSGPTKEAQ